MSRNPVFRLTISREIELLAGELAIESESEGDKNEEQHAYPTPSTDRRAGKKNHVTLMTKSKLRGTQLRCFGLSPTPRILIKPCQNRSTY